MPANLTTIRAGDLVLVIAPTAPDFQLIGTITAIHYANSDCPSYLVSFGPYARPYGAAALEVLPPVPAPDFRLLAAENRAAALAARDSLLAARAADDFDGAQAVAGARAAYFLAALAAVLRALGYRSSDEAAMDRLLSCPVLGAVLAARPPVEHEPIMDGLLNHPTLATPTFRRMPAAA